MEEKDREELLEIMSEAAGSDAPASEEEKGEFRQKIE